MQLLVSFKLLRAKIILGFFPLAFFLITKPQQSWWKLYKNSLIYKQFEFDHNSHVGQTPSHRPNDGNMNHGSIQLTPLNSKNSKADESSKKELSQFSAWAQPSLEERKDDSKSRPEVHGDYFEPNAEYIYREQVNFI